MPRVKKRGRGQTSAKPKNDIVSQTTSDFEHKFLVDQGSGNNSPLYYMLIFFTLSLMIAAIYVGVDSYQRLSMSRIDSFESCINHPKSMIRESNPRVCITWDKRNFFEQSILDQQIQEAEAFNN